MSNDAFKKELQCNVQSVFDEDKVKKIMESAEKFMGINNVANGRAFFEQVILDAPKDYPTDDMRFYQSLTELKSRLGRMFDDTLALQKLEVELEILEIELAEMPSTNRKEELQRMLKQQDVTQKKIRIAFAKDSLNSLAKDIEDFTGICDKYWDTGKMKPYEIARLEEMDKKKKALYLNHVVTGRQLSPSETAFFYQSNGLLRPPEGTVQELQKLGFNQLAAQEQDKMNRIDVALGLAAPEEKLQIAASTPAEDDFNDAITLVDGKDVE